MDRLWIANLFPLQHLSQLQALLIVICEGLSGAFFKNTKSYYRFVEQESRVAVQMALLLELFCFGEFTVISFIDGSSIPVCHNKRTKSNNVFNDHAERGKSKMGWLFLIKGAYLAIDTIKSRK